MSSLWKTLLRPDYEELELKDRLAVISAANQLQVGEFQLLQLAYREWHDKDLPEVLVSRLFTSYILQNEVPHWAQHYARRVIERYERGQLDENAPSFHRYDHDYHTSVPRGLQRFLVAAASIAIAVFGSIYIANEVVESPTSLLPPYFEKKDLQRVMPDENEVTGTRKPFTALGSTENFINVSLPGR